VKRSCEFLKAGVAAGLSPAELSDAYLRHQDSIFDTPDDNTKPAAFARVIADVQAKSPMRQKALKALPTPDHCIPVADELVKLGWDVPSFTKEAKPEAKAGLFQMILTNPLLYDMQQNKTPNPFLQQEIDDLEQQCIAEGIDVVAKKNAKGNDVPMAYRKTLMNNLSSTQLRKRNAQADLDAKALPGGVFAKNTHKEIYAECFLADGGAAKLANASGDPMENLKAYMDAEEQRWNLSGLAKKFNESFPEEEEDTAQPTKVDNGSGDGAKANATTDASPNAVTIKRCKRFKMMRAFAQYEAEGGNSDYEALGCDKSIPYDSPSARLKELRSAKKLKAQLKALEDLAKPKAATATAQPVQPAQQNQPVQPKATDKRQAVKDVSTRAEVLNKRIAVLEPVMRDNLMKRLLAAMRTGTGGELDEALRLIGELEEELDVQEASSTS
jgi:hypothetical protein